jgi:hypothetical protein
MTHYSWTLGKKPLAHHAKRVATGDTGNDGEKHTGDREKDWRTLSVRSACIGQWPSG